MARNWWRRLLGRRAINRTAVRPSARLRLERLEDLVTPTVTLSNLTLTPSGPINEGHSATLTGNYTATNVNGQLQLTVTASAPILGGGTFTLSPTGTSFSIPLTFEDNNTPSTTAVTVTAKLADTGPAILTGPDGSSYQAISTPYLSGSTVNAGDISLANAGTSAGVITDLLPNSTTNNQNAQIGLGTDTFTFYGQSVGNQIGINENGLVTFFGLAPSTADTNGQLSSLPSGATGIGAVAPLWTNLKLASNGKVLHRFVDVNGDGVNDYLVIEWSNVAHIVTGGGTSSGTGTFQVFLQLNTGSTNGDIIFNYVGTNFGDTASNFGANATVGIKSQLATNGNILQVAANPGSASSIIQNLSNHHTIRITSNSINTPPKINGPDAFGYTSFRTPFESKDDIVASSNGGQTTTTAFSAPFTSSSGGFPTFNQSLISTIMSGSAVVSNNEFTHYGTQYTSINIARNGFITFGGAPSGVLPNNTNMAGGPAPATLAPLWDDWVGPSGQVPTAAQVITRYVDYDGDGHPEYLIIDWKSVSNNGIATSPANSATFEAILQLNTGTAPGQVYYNYTDTDVGNAGFNNGASASIGLKDVNPTSGKALDISVNTSDPDAASSHAIGVFPSSTATGTTTIQVNNVAPVLSANSSDNLSPNEGNTFTRTIFVTDPGVLDNFTGTVNYGDGSAAQNLTLAAGTTSFQISHLYGNEKAGGYTVTINLTDKDGGVATPLTFVVNVQSVAPTITFVAPSRAIRPGQTVTLNGVGTNPFLAKFTDPGFTVASAGATESFTTTVDWGDGTVVTAPPNTATLTQTVTQGSAGVLTQGTVAGSHTYSDRGTFTVTVTVTDDDGNVATGSFQVGVGASHVYVASADAGGAPEVKVFDSNLHVPYLDFLAYDPSFSGGVRTAVGDITGDGLPDIVTAAGPGGGPHVKVFDNATGDEVASFYAYDPGFTGGVYVAVGDVNHDGVPDIITGADAGGGPHVKVFDGASLRNGKVVVIDSFFAYAASFAGGVRVAAADINGDGFADIITGAGPGGGPHVKVFSGKDLSVIRSFYAYDGAFAGGVFVAAGDVNHDGQQDIVTGPGLGGGPHLRVFDGSTNGALIEETMAFNPGTPGGGSFIGGSVWQSGLRVATTDINQDGAFDIIVAPGVGEPPLFRILNGLNLTDLTPSGQSPIFSPDFLGGVFVAGD
jgi:hypothetical protein